jgi:cytochrome c biogenesis protein CcmG/thiol:disulfide interchange protein DsbE
MQSGGASVLDARRRMSRLLAALGLVAAISAGPAFARDPVVGKPAPDFSVFTFDGKKISLSDLKGQVVVLNFWATWCAPCRNEMPLLDDYYKAQQRFGLKVFAVSTEDSAPLSKIKPVAALFAISVVRGFRGPYQSLGAVPTNYVIDRAGVLRYAKANAFTNDSLNAILVPLLQEPAPQPAADTAPVSLTQAAGQDSAANSAH